MTPRAMLLAVVAASTPTLSGCSCEENGSKSHPDAYPDDDEDDDGTETTDTGSDNCLGEDYQSEDAFPFDWQPLPEGMDCGPGCRQLTFEGTPLSWDVWKNTMVVNENSGGGWSFITLVDTEADSTFPVVSQEFNDGTWVSHCTAHESGITFVWDSATLQPQWGKRYVTISGGMKEVGLLDRCSDSLYGIDCTDNHCAYPMSYNPNPGMQDLIVFQRNHNERRRVTSFGGVGEVSISGDWVTFTALYVGGVDIFAYNVITEELRNLSDHPKAQFNSRNDGPRVVWTDLRNSPTGSYGGDYSDADIYYYDIETDELRQITSGNGIQFYPDIHGDWIVWQDYRDCPDPDNPYDGTCLRIWGFNLGDEQEVMLSHVAGQHARVWGDKVFFVRGSRVHVQVIGLSPGMTANAGPDAGPREVR